MAIIERYSLVGNKIERDKKKSEIKGYIVIGISQQNEIDGWKIHHILL